MPKQNSQDEFLSRTLKSRVPEAPDAPFLEARIWNAIQAQESAPKQGRFWKLAPSLAGVLGILLAITVVQQKTHLVTRLMSRPMPSPAATAPESWESDFADGFEFFTSFDVEDEVAFY